MITLFVIVLIATFVLAAARAEGMRPLGLALVGTISLVLGAQTTAVFTETSVAPFVDSMVFAQESSTTDPAPAESTSSSGEEIADSVSTPATATDATETPATTDDATEDDAATPAATDDSESSVSGTTSATEPGVAPAVDAVAPELTQPITVEAITNVKYLDRGEDTPSWLETKPWRKEGVYFAPVVSRLQISEADRDRALDQEIKTATDDYINELLDNKHATTLLKLRSANTIPKIMGSFEEQVVVTAGTMHQSHALLAFDKDFQNAITTEWDEVRATSRLMQTGLGAGIVILLLSTMFSYFKLDTATRGYYTGRLQFAAAAAILAVIAVSVLFANYVPWM